MNRRGFLGAIAVVAAAPVLGMTSTPVDADPVRVAFSMPPLAPDFTNSALGSRSPRNY